MLTAEQVLERYRADESPWFIDNPPFDVNQVGSNGDRPLHIACIHVSLEEVRALVEGGAIINVAGEMGYFPLHYAASHSAEITEYLLEKGADPRCQNYWGDTPLQLAESLRCEEAARVLRNYT